MPPPDYNSTIDRNRLAKRITVESFYAESKEKRVWECYPTKGRKDQYRVTLDGRAWRDRVSMSQLFEHLRKAR